MIGIPVEVGHLERVEFRHEACERADRNAGKIDAPELDLLDHRFFLAELGAGIHLDDDAAIRALLDKARELLIAQFRGIALRMGLGEPQHNRLCLGEQHCRDENEQQDKN